MTLTRVRRCWLVLLLFRSHAGRYNSIIDKHFNIHVRIQRGGGGAGGPDPLPEKSQKYKVS